MTGKLSPLESSDEMKSATILLSGGIDSTACIEFYLSKPFYVQAFFVDYGQVSIHHELKAVREIALYYDLPLKIISCQNVSPKDGGVINGRNAFLLFTAMMELNSPTGLLVIGIHSGTTYPDCSGEFIQAVQSLFDIYLDGRLYISAPFLDWTKSDIWHYCLQRKVPLNLTYSCELGKPQPCGICLSCKDLECLRALPKLSA